MNIIISRIVVVSGSRFDDVPQQRVFNRLDCYLYHRQPPQNASDDYLNSILRNHNRCSRDELLVIHGGQTGVDTLAHTWCSQRGVRAISIPVFFESRGKLDGPDRNSFILTTAIALSKHYALGPRDLIVEGFPGPRSSGTYDCLEQARELGLRYHCHPWKGAPDG